MTAAVTAAAGRSRSNISNGRNIHVCESCGSPGRACKSSTRSWTELARAAGETRGGNTLSTVKAAVLYWLRGSTRPRVAHPTVPEGRVQSHYHCGCHLKVCFWLWLQLWTKLEIVVLLLCSELWQSPASGNSDGLAEPGSAGTQGSSGRLCMTAHGRQLWAAALKDLSPKGSQAAKILVS